MSTHSTTLTPAMRKKQYLTHIQAAFNEIERLSSQYLIGIERLEAMVLSNLSIDSITQWFRMYLRVVDVGIEIRRGEIRHQTSRPIGLFPCMHRTGGRSALHSGLSIDDANALYQELERLGTVRSSVLEELFLQIDRLDRDHLSNLEKRLQMAIAMLLQTSSPYYTQLEWTRIDPHETLIIYSHSCSTVVSRICFDPTTCVCVMDAQPWTDFILTRTIVPSSVPVPVPEPEPEEIRLNELKRQYGFETVPEAEPIIKRRSVEQFSSSSPQSHYRQKCLERGTIPKKKIEQLLSMDVPHQTTLSLDLSQFGFHTFQDLQDIVEIIQELQIPIVSLNLTNNFFDAASFEILKTFLRLSMVRNYIKTLCLRCLALPQRTAFATLLRVLTEEEGLKELRTLDVSYNTFMEDAVLSLNDLIVGLKHLTSLSLEACFPKAPDPAVVEVAVVKDLVRNALVMCCERVLKLNFSSNWMSFPLFNSLFSSSCALEEIYMTQMTFFYFPSSQNEKEKEEEENVEMNWSFHFERQKILLFSETRHSRMEYLPFFLDALIVSLQQHTTVLKQMDLWFLSGRLRKQVPISLISLDEYMVTLLQALTQYQQMESLRLGIEDATANQNTRSVVAQLFYEGLRYCHALDLAVGLPLSLIELGSLLERSNVPHLKTCKLRILLRSSDSDPPALQVFFTTLFTTSLASLTSLVLELHYETSSPSDSILVALETAWTQASDSNATISRHMKKRNNIILSLDR